MEHRTLLSTAHVDTRHVLEQPAQVPRVRRQPLDARRLAAEHLEAVRARDREHGGHGRGKGVALAREALVVDHKGGAGAEAAGAADGVREARNDEVDLGHLGGVSGKEKVGMKRRGKGEMA